VPEVCNAMDRWGDHAIQCRLGGGGANTYRHKPVRDWLFRMAREFGVSVWREPALSAQIPGSDSQRPDLVLVDWDNGRDLYVDVVGTSPLTRSYRSSFVPWGAVGRVAALKAASHRDTLPWQPPRVLSKLRPFAFDVCGVLRTDSQDLLKRLQGVVSQASFVHEELIWYCAHRRVGFTIAEAVVRQLATRLPEGGWCTGLRG
jgi:hypothetical protein